MIPYDTVTGRGGGLAASVSLKDKATCNKVSIAKIQKILKKQGAWVQQAREAAHSIDECLIRKHPQFAADGIGTGRDQLGQK